ncbi:MAG: NADH-quinone oxidoreductase subunit N [Cytophagales bacterium]|nr:NADH-quinone oxidoreductase subunit N [Cytophagales bacterium]
MKESITGSIIEVLAGGGYLLPELVMCACLLIIPLSGLVAKNKQKSIVIAIYLAALCLSMYYTVLQLQYFYEQNQAIYFFGKMLFINEQNVFLKILFKFCGLFALLLTEYNSYTRKFTSVHFEYYMLILAVILGSNLMVMSSDFFMAFISLEMISVCSYILVAVVNNKKTAEASAKYLIFGMFSSAIMLYGISLSYGITGAFTFYDNQYFEAFASVSAIARLAVLVMLLSGIMFKTSIFPFHIWTPDVYEATPAPLIAFFSTITKIAGFGLLVNILMYFAEVEIVLWGKVLNSHIIIGILAVVTTTWANMAAFFQTNVKRMLGYSAIAQSGFILMPFCLLSEFALDTFYFYVATYIIMSFGIFYLTDRIMDSAKSESFDVFRGVGIKYPIWGIFLIIILISLTGLPPTVGFTGKFLIFSSLWEDYQTTGERIFLVVLLAAAANTVLSLFYYVKIPYYMFFKPMSEVHVSIKNHTYVAGAVFAIIITGLFFYPTPLIDFIKNIMD